MMRLIVVSAVADSSWSQWLQLNAPKSSMGTGGPRRSGSLCLRNLRSTPPRRSFVGAYTCQPASSLVVCPTGLFGSYCLGYGEDELLDERVARNSGTPQFWKILQGCLHPIRTNQDFAPILKCRTRSLHCRISNKLAVLQALKEQGVWLVDASIVALYPKPSPSLARQALEVSWDRHMESVLMEAAPEAILCIGLGVAATLGTRLDRMRIPWADVPQPNARLSAAAHMRIFETYYRLAQDPAYIARVNKQIWSAG